MKGGGSGVAMKKDKEYGLVSGDEELRILRRLDKEITDEEESFRTNAKVK
ncbi:hypothetical protein WOSG25_210150 [Weissella oryzae SG25]|uniref:Uncharacterized protein n=1 Tax=Weissella oryzae (strain DSM 25784 / JCM 18191 / LMG 30913 / SG25) TaxID=1329250 RepID=A0A069CXJ0_WEIOS|nr:hypothetical protein [Weissella oryzae]GAK31958.1 hypothetical protein WOSG25_210150 [Weissella oryzae SG25]